MNNVYIPPKTAELMTGSHPPGTRHEAAKNIAISLIGNGMAPSAVFAQLRDTFPPEKTDDELRKLVEYAMSINPKPSGFGGGGSMPAFRPIAKPAPAPKQKTPEEQAAWWLSGAQMTHEEFSQGSQLAIPESPRDALILFFEMLYTGAENLNIVCKFGMNEDKARPDGPGQILTRDKWVEYVNKNGIPSSKAGSWFRPNPVLEKGSGSSGAVTDSDVAAHRFLLLESDRLPVGYQFALFSKLKLPIAAAYMSGGISVHALVRIDAKTAEEFDKKARRITSALAVFGIDQSNKNPSRLSRLPSAKRVIGAAGDGLQKLLWLNPNRVAVTDKEIDDFEETLLIPAIEEKPFKRLVLNAIDRYQEMVENRGKLGVPTGFARFDRISGGLKPGGYTIIAGNTGSGKSTVALNMVNSALKAGHGVVLFSLELGCEDVTDMLFSMNCAVDRNHFNNGEFSNTEIQSMTRGVAWMKDLPLWVDDDPDLTMDAMRRRVLALKADGRVGLVVLDYAQLVSADVRADSREQAVAAVAFGLRLLSKQANLPIIALSQLNDDGKLRESRRLAHEAANVFTIQRKPGESAITLFIDKGRKIPSEPIRLHFNAEHCLVREEVPSDE